jgi:hypothetical protein
VATTHSLDVPPSPASIIITGVEGFRGGPEAQRKRERDPKDTRLE